VAPHCGAAKVCPKNVPLPGVVKSGCHRDGFDSFHGVLTGAKPV
jgi:hypothetical protein